MNLSQIKIIFFGTSEFAVPILEKLVKSSYNVISVITTPDRPVGRKQEITPPPIKQAALEQKLTVLQPDKMDEIQSKVSEINPDLIILAAYGKIISANTLSIPQFGCLNLHPSLLPKYRGASPIQTAILNGDQSTGISIMLMDARLDHGPIVAQKKIIIAPKENGQTLEKKLAQEAAILLIEILPKYLQGKIQPKPQEDAQATFTKTLKREDGQIDWKQSAREIEQKVRAFYPWPGTWTHIDGQRVKIIRAKAVDKEENATLPTGQGFLLLEKVQPAGKQQMTGQDFFRGHGVK